MKNFISISFLFILLFNFSCKKEATTLKDDALGTVPADISMLTAIKPAQLLEKAKFEEVKKMELYLDILKITEKGNKAAARMLADPYNSGVDLTNNIYVTQDVNARNPNDIFTAVVFSLDDPATFKNLVQDANLGAFQEGLGYQYAAKDKEGAVAFNDKFGVLGFNYRMRDLRPYLDKIFTTEKANSIRENSQLAKCLNSDSDIISWASSNTIADNPEAKMAMGMINIKAEDLKDNYIHNHLDFENGRVKGTSRYFIKKGITKDIKLFFNDEVATDFSQYIPGENLGFAMAAAINFKGINQVLSERPQIKSFVDYVLQEYGLSMSDVANALGGDLLVAGYGGETVAESNALVATNIDDKKIFDKFLLAMKAYGMLNKTANGVYDINNRMLQNYFSRGNINAGNIKPQMILKDDLLFITADPGIVEAINNGGYKTAEQADQKIMKLMNSNIFAMFMDLENLESWNDGELQNLQITTDENQADFDMFLQDKEDNSLYNLLKFANKIYVKEKANNPNIKTI